MEQFNFRQNTISLCPRRNAKILDILMAVLIVVTACVIYSFELYNYICHTAEKRPKLERQLFFSFRNFTNQFHQNTSISNATTPNRLAQLRWKWFSAPIWKSNLKSFKHKWHRVNSIKQFTFKRSFETTIMSKTCKINATVSSAKPFSICVYYNMIIFPANFSLPTMNI